MGINKSNVTDRERALFLTFVKWKNLVGSLVRCDDMSGLGLVNQVRVWNDQDVHVRVLWIVSPFTDVKSRRLTTHYSWHAPNAIIVISEMQKTL